MSGPNPQDIPHPLHGDPYAEINRVNQQVSHSQSHLQNSCLQKLSDLEIAVSKT